MAIRTGNGGGVVRCGYSNPAATIPHRSRGPVEFPLRSISTAVRSDDKKNTKKKAGIIVGLVALVVAATAIGAGTYAAFTDTETGPGGTQTAGTLDLQVGGDDTATALFSASNVAPGFGQNYTFTLDNTGSIAGTLRTR
ncbi:CalY family protein [Pseudonocardia kujensis]|uniref:TasA family protein n=1 Tax=Pseudonocardia kujensis TaxID=1128675 RepID=UPI001E43BE81|nr:TasA family protein [Pseudonocardia kujensis]MCE0762670.1 CalY family protein [Pseudonocardia kujensis]